MKVGKPKQLWQLAFDHDWPTSVAFLKNGRFLAAGNRRGEILLWDLSQPPSKSTGKTTKDAPNLKPARKFVGHDNAITHLVNTPDGKTLISSSLDRTIRFWNPDASPTGTGDVVLDFKSRVRKSRRKSEKIKEKILFAPGLSIQTVKATKVLGHHRDWIKALDISSNGKRIISGDDSCVTIVYDLATNKVVSRWTGYNRVWVSSVALSPDAKTAFTAEFAGSRSSFDRPAAQARVWNADDGKMKLDLLKTWTPKVTDKDRIDSYGYARTWGKLMKRGLIAAQYSADGSRLAVAQGGETSKGQVHLIDTKSGKILRTVSGHRSGACDVKFSADGKLVLSSGRDTTVRICKVSDGKEIAALGRGRGGQFKDWLSAIAISADQKHVAAADIAGMIHVWQL